MASIYFVACIAATLLLVLFQPLAAGLDEESIFQVFVNSVNKGTFILWVSPEGDVLIPEENLKELGLESVLADQKRISLLSLKGKLTFKIEKGSILHITAHPSLLTKSTIDLSHHEGTHVVRTNDNAAFLNYGFRYEVGDRLNFESFSLPSEFGISLNGILGFSSFSYSRSPFQDHFVRLSSNITSDDQENHTRLIVGDFTAFTGELGSGGSFGGISFSKNYSMTPYFTKYPGLDFSGVLHTPSDVELYVNGLLIRKETLNPGEFEFSNLRSIIGAGDAMIVIKDSIGREQRIYLPFYFSTALLKAGLHDYSYNLGFRRKSIGIRSFDYNELTLLGFHKFGFAKTLTAGVHTEATHQLINLAPTATFLVSRSGEMTTSFAVSHFGSRTGYGLFLNYIYTGKHWNARAAIKGFTKDYTNLSLQESQNRMKLEKLVSLGFHGRHLGSLTFAISDSRTYKDEKQRTASVFYSRPFLKNTSFFLNLNYLALQAQSTNILAGVNLFLGARNSANVSYQKDDQQSKQTISLQKNAPRGSGYAYRLLADSNVQNGSQHLSGLASFQYRGNPGIYGLEYRSSGQNQTYQLSFAGGITFINKSFYFSRPVTDSFALVQVSDLKDVKLYYGGEMIGKTRSKGRMIVPELVSYIGNPLSIDDKTIPVNYNIHEKQKVVAPSLRGGSVIRFDVSKLQGFEGKLFIRDGNKRIAAQYARIEFKAGEKEIDTVSGTGGEFYVENILPGAYSVKLFHEERECTFTLKIPESSEPMIDLGEITCRIH